MKNLNHREDINRGYYSDYLLRPFKVPETFKSFILEFESSKEALMSLRNFRSIAKIKFEFLLLMKEGEAFAQPRIPT